MDKDTTKKLESKVQFRQERVILPQWNEVEIS